MRRRYRKQQNQNLLFISAVAVVAIALSSGAVGNSPRFSDTTKVIFFAFCTVTIVVISIIFIYLIYNALTRKSRARNLAALHAHRVDQMSGEEFEIFLKHLFTFRGYEVQHTGRSNDGGVDLVVKKGKEKISIQAKRYTGKADRRAITDAVAGMKLHNCTHAMAITNSRFTKPAIEYAKKTDCRLIDRDGLAKWISELN
jgi:restriction system protein